jgi:hypothetical protein
LLRLDLGEQSPAHIPNLALETPGDLQRERGGNDPAVLGVPRRVCEYEVLALGREERSQDVAVAKVVQQDAVAVGEDLRGPAYEGDVVVFRKQPKV